MRPLQRNLSNCLVLAALVFLMISAGCSSGDSKGAAAGSGVAPEVTAVVALTEEGLIEAVRDKNTDAIAQILEAGVSADTTDFSGDPILKAAIRSRSPEVVALLVAHGADVNALDADGNALLPQAARLGNPEIVQTLVEAGADLEGTLVASATGVGVWEATALNWAALDNRLEIARYLIEQGADINAGDPIAKRTPLHTASWKNNAGMVTLLLENGADPDALSIYPNGRPIHFAIVGSSVDAIEALLAGGATVDIQSETSQTPLMYAQVEGMSSARGQIVTLLLEAGADPNLQNNIGNTALHQAAKWDRLDAIKILVEHGASLEVQNMRGETPLDVAIDERIVELLTELGGG